MHTSALLTASFALGALTIACGGTQVPTHNGYKSKKSKPWAKPKVLRLKKAKAHHDFHLAYARHRRARWLAVDLPGPGTLDVRIDVTPASASSIDPELDMDVGFEIVDGKTWRVLATSNLESPDAHELKKRHTLRELPVGRYLVHTYLQGRLDEADVDVDVEFERGAIPWQSDFPNQVAFVGPIAAVPPLDDAPQPRVVRRHRPRHTRPAVPVPEQPETAGMVVAPISDVQPDPGGGTLITIGGGTADGLENGMKGSIKGVRNSGFSLRSCRSATCRARVRAPIDSVRGARGVTIKLQ